MPAKLVGAFEGMDVILERRSNDANESFDHTRQRLGPPGAGS